MMVSMNGENRKYSLVKPTNARLIFSVIGGLLLSIFPFISSIIYPISYKISSFYDFLTSNGLKDSYLLVYSLFFIIGFLSTYFIMVLWEFIGGISGKNKLFVYPSLLTLLTISMQLLAIKGGRISLENMTYKEFISSHTTFYEISIVIIFLLFLVLEFLVGKIITNLSKRKIKIYILEITFRTIQTLIFFFVFIFYLFISEVTFFGLF